MSRPGRETSPGELRPGAPCRAARALGERLAINSVVQGSAADLIKAAMANVQRRIDRERRPLKLLLFARSIHSRCGGSWRSDALAPSQRSNS